MYVYSRFLHVGLKLWKEILRLDYETNMSSLLWREAREMTHIQALSITSIAAALSNRCDRERMIKHTST